MSMDAPPEDKQSDATASGDNDRDAPSDAFEDPSLHTAPPIESDPSMSDEEAKRLLAAMDEPFIPDIPELPQDVAEMQNTAFGKETTVEPDTMTDQDHGTIGDAEEIQEFSQNEFASDPEMLNDFTQNSGELMESLDQNVLVLEQNPTDKETIESIFRAAHTLKGAAGMFGFHAIERVMHRMENLFDLVRKGALIPTPDTIDVVFRGLDTLRVLLAAVATQIPSGIKTGPVVQALDLAIQGRYLKTATSSREQLRASPSEQPVSKVEKHPATSGPGAPHQAKAPSTKPPTAPGHSKATEHPAGDPLSGESGAKKTDQSTIRVDLERLDMLVNLVGELVIDRTRFAAIENEFRASAPQLKATSILSETVQLFGRHMNEIHEIIMKIRMVPIGNAFNKFTRVVRDLARQLGKDIQIEILGEDTELDKTLVEQIGDPLIHLIRNSCDHGIESPEVRGKTEKPQTGTIRLSAKQEGHHVIITIADDGKGIPVDAVRRKGIERGLIKENDILTNRDIFNLIFEPGFSTAEQVTTVSGRGVGMDVVRKQIGKLKGIIDIDSEQGKGTKTTIRLPLTLAIVQSLLIKSSDSTFAIPLSSVIESVRIKPDDIQYIGEAEVIKRHDKVLPLMYLADVLGMASKVESSWYDQERPTGDKKSLARAQDPNDRNSNHQNLRPEQIGEKSSDQRLFVVIVGSGEKRFGIVVDQLLHQQEMVIKSMGALMHGVPCIAGGAVLGNGEVVLVIDVPELEEQFRTRGSPFNSMTA
jgi:two-component system chemotaxis sensor kinase CheA